MKKKLISMLLVSCMLLTSAPMTALAAEVEFSDSAEDYEESDEFVAEFTEMQEDDEATGFGTGGAIELFSNEEVAEAFVSEETAEAAALEETGIVYLDGNADQNGSISEGLDTNDGATAETAVGTLQRAVTLAKEKNAKIVVLDGVQLKGTTDEPMNFEISDVIIERGENYSGTLVQMFYPETTVTLNNVIVDGKGISCEPDLETGYMFHLYQGAVLNIQGNTELKNNKASTIFMDGSYFDASEPLSKVNMSNGVISNNEGNLEDRAGGVTIRAGIFEMTGGIIEKNVAGSTFYEADGFTRQVGAGVCIFSPRGTFNMKGGTISENDAGVGPGGGVYNQGGTINLTGGEIKNNTAIWGAGVASCGADAADKCKTLIDGVKIKDNECIGNGAGVYFENSQVEMRSGEITGNISEQGNGGGVFGYYWSDTTVMKISGGTIKDNKCTQWDAGNEIALNGNGEAPQLELSGSPVIYDDVFLRKDIIPDVKINVTGELITPNPADAIKITLPTLEEAKKTETVLVTYAEGLTPNLDNFIFDDSEYTLGVKEQDIIIKKQTKLSLESNPPVSVIRPATYGDNITYTAKLESEVLGDEEIPTGIIQLYLDGKKDTNLIGEINGSELSVTLDRTKLTKGYHRITAVYNGSNRFEEVEKGVTFGVDPKTLEYDVSGLTVEKYADGTNTAAKVKGALKILAEGILESDEVVFEYTGINAADFTNSGPHTEEVVLTVEGAMLTGTHAGNYKLPKELKVNAEIKQGYPVTIENGTAAISGEVTKGAAEGMIVEITANTAPVGRCFKEWQIISGNVELESEISATTTFKMPGEAVSIKAVYENLYNITVTNGTASAIQSKAGETIIITANPAPYDYSFYKWDVVSGDITLVNPWSRKTSFTMPAGDVAVKATYYYDPYIPPTTPTPIPDPIPDNYPEGSERNPDGSITTPNGTEVDKDGTITLPDGTELKPDEEGNKPTIDKDNNVTDTNGTVIDKDGNITLPGKDSESATDDTKVETGTGSKPPKYDPETGNVTTEDGNKVTLPGGQEITPPAGSVVEKDGTITEPDGTIIDPDGTIHNTDGSIQSSDGTYLRPATPMLESAEIGVSGNQVKTILSGECAGAEGYDYVISENINCIVEKDYLARSRNILKTDTAFYYIPAGTYYVYCHAYTRDENGKKVFSEWSNYRMVTVTAITPEIPEITDVRVKGRNVIVTYTNCENADGYDIILGRAYKSVNGEKRPVDYIPYVQKIKNGNTTTAIFRNVPKGRYFAGLHAWNRTSEDGKKVFSPWSKSRRVIVK